MRFFVTAIIIIMVLINSVAYASVMHANISENEVIKSYSFKGKRLYVKISYSHPVILIAKITGPKKEFKIVEQVSKYGVLIKGSTIELDNQESFYKLYTSSLVFYNNSNLNLAKYDLDLNNFLRAKKLLGTNNSFYNYMIANNFYFIAPKEIVDNIAYKVMKFIIDLPPNCSEGIYTVDLYGFSNNFKLLDKKKLTFIVHNSEAYSFFKKFSKTHKFEYTVLTICIAISIGLIAGYVNNGKRSID